MKHAILTLDPAGLVASWNAGAQTMTGYAREEIIGQHFRLFFTAEKQAAEQPGQALETARTQGQWHGGGWRVRKNGNLFLAGVFMEALNDAKGRLIGFAVFIRDETLWPDATGAEGDMLTSLHSARSDLERAHERLRLATDSGGIGIWDWDIIHNVMLWDDWMYRLYGTTRGGGGTGYELWQRNLHPDDRAATEQAVADALNGTSHFATAFRIIWDDGSIHHIRASGSVTRDANGQALHMIGFNQDVTPLVLAEQARNAQQAQSKHWLELAEEIAHVGHWAITMPEQGLFWSDEILRIHGLEKGGFVPSIGAAIEAFHPDDREKISAAITTAIAEKTGFEVQARIIRPSGEVRHILTRGLVQLDHRDRVASIFGVFIDVTQQKDIEQRLERANLLANQANEVLEAIAHTDGLTGLPNRREFDRTLNIQFKSCIRERMPISLIMIDIDYFKRFNDFYGHLAGDACLRRVATAISGALRRQSDMAARYGGEEIAVVLHNTKLTGASAVAQMIVEAVRAEAIPHPKSPEGIVTVSCGVATIAHPTNAIDQTTLIELADNALYRAKNSGRNQASHSSASASLKMVG